MADPAASTIARCHAGRSWKNRPSSPCSRRWCRSPTRPVSVASVATTSCRIARTSSAVGCSPALRRVRSTMRARTSAGAPRSTRIRSSRCQVVSGTAGDVEDVVGPSREACAAAVGSERVGVQERVDDGPAPFVHRGHAVDANEPAGGDRLDPVLGLAPPGRPQGRAEAEEEAVGAHAEPPGGEEVAPLVEHDRGEQRDHEDRDGDASAHGGLRGGRGSVGGDQPVGLAPGPGVRLDNVGHVAGRSRRCAPRGPATTSAMPRNAEPRRPGRRPPPARWRR